MKRYYIIGIAALALAFTGCSKHDDDKTLDTWRGEIRLASGITVQTRAHQDYQSTQLDANNLVGIFINEHGGNTTTYEQNMPYTANGMGGFIAPPTIYFPASGNPVNIYAYAPYDALCSNLMGTYTFTVKSNQHSQANYIASDLLWGESMNTANPSEKLNPVSRTKDAINLNFRHLLSKVRVTLKDGAGVTTEDVIKVELLNLLPSIDLKMSDGTISVAKGSKGNVVLFDTKVYTTTNASAIVVPQTVANGSKFLRFDLEEGGELFYTLPREMTMESGKIYDFTITLNLTGLTITSTVTDWVTGEVFEGGAEMEAQPIGSKKPVDAAIGDFYFSDSSLEDKDAILTDAQKAACLGIVYWVGDPTNSTDGDPLLKANHPYCTHGLVVALHEAKQPSTSTPAKMKWSVSYEQVNAWTNHPDRGANKVDITEQNKLQGYTNTVALKLYNGSSNVSNNADFKVLPIAAIEQFHTDYPAPASSSGWYVPSIMELKQICLGQGVTSNNTAGLDMLNSQLDKASGTIFDGLHGWSSSESINFIEAVLIVDFSNGYVYNYAKSNHQWVRAVFAF